MMFSQPVGLSHKALSSPVPPQFHMKVLASLVCLALLGGCAEERIRRESLDAIKSGDYEHGVQVLENGQKKYPDSSLIQSALIQTKTSAIESLLESASTLSAQGRMNEARTALDRAQSLDPSHPRIKNLRAQFDIEDHQNAALKSAETLVNKQQREAALKLIDQALKDNPRHAGLLTLQRRLSSELRRQQVEQVQAALSETRPISLDFREANLRTVLDLVSRNSGINFILDKDIKPDVRVTVLMKQARVEDALDLIVSTNQLAKKIIDPQTIVIYPNTAEKQREYQEQVVRVFYLASAEAKNAAAFLKSMLKIHEPFVDDRSNMLALRETPDNIQLAERLLALYDNSDPEVLLDVEVLEINANKTLQAGVSLPSSVGVSINPISNSSSNTSPALTLANVGHLTRNEIGITVGSATVNLNRQMGDFTTLANPSIRAKNKEKAKVMVGEKIPVISATTGQAGFVTDTVTYLDVGLKLDVEPTVYADDDVMIKLGLEVSTLGAAVQTSSGTLAYQISTRNAATILRLHDNESQLLAGLISKDESHSSAGIPGLDSLPLLGRLFANKTDTDNRTELVLVITPHILRNIRPSDASETELWVGTDAQPKIRPFGGLRNMAPKEPSSAAGPVGAAAPASPNAGAASQAADSDRPAQPTQPTTQLLWSKPAPIKVGDTVDLTLDEDTQAALRGMTLEVGYDHSHLQLVDAIEGDFFKQGGAVTSFSRSDDPKDPVLRLGLLRNQATAATGRGQVMTLRFKALAAGSTEVKVLGTKPIGLAATLAAPVALPSATLQVH